MTQEPIQTQPNQSANGRHEITEDQYRTWLDDMRPYLRQGQSLNYAINKTGLSGHRTSLYEKYAQNDWFSDKIDNLRATIAELNNSSIFKIIEGVHTKLVESDRYAPSSAEVRIMVLVAEKHRSSQTHWITRIEEAQAKKEDVGQVIERPTINVILHEEDDRS